MRIKIYLRSKTNSVFAEALFEDGKTTILPGGKVSKDFAEHIRGGKTARSYRNNPEYVNEEGLILRECVFSSPSTASQFVTGRSTNGYETWKVENKKSLGTFLREQGLK